MEGLKVGILGKGLKIGKCSMWSLLFPSLSVIRAYIGNWDIRSHIYEVNGKLRVFFLLAYLVQK